MLKALARWILRGEATPTQERHSRSDDLEGIVRAEVRRALVKTEEETDAKLKKISEQIEWELGEWYEKFSTLHARTAMRAQREAHGGGGGAVAPNGAASALRPSVLHHRKPWSP